MNSISSDRKSVPMTRGRLSFLMACLVFLLLSLTTKANTFYVTNLGDAGPGSLRQAILDANNTTAGLPHTVVFRVSGNIVLQSSLPVIKSAGLTVDGGKLMTLTASSGGDVGITFFDINANGVTVGGFTLLNSGAAYVVVEPNTLGVTVRNIVANQYTGYYMDYIVYVAGASTNLSLSNIRCSQGLQINANGSNWNFFYFSAGVQKNLVMDSIYVSNGTTNYGSGGIYFNSTPVQGWKFTNSRIACVSNPIFLNGNTSDTASLVVLNNVVLDSTGGSYGFYSNYVNNGVTLKRVTLTPGQSATYGISFANPSKYILLDSLSLLGNNSYSVWFSGGVDSNIQISHSTLNNLKGGTGHNAFRFDQPMVNLTMTKDSIDESITATSSGSYGLTFTNTVTNAILDSIVINRASADGIYASNLVRGFSINHSKFTGNYVAVDLLGNALHTGVKVQNSSFLNSTFASAGAFQVNTSTAPDSLRFIADTVANNAGSGIRVYNGSVQIYDTVTNCVIYGNGAYGVLVDNGPTGVVVTNNSIYNNKSGGIGMTGNGNCAYTGVGKVPVMVSSTPQGPGVWQLQITVPNVVPGATYALDVYANDPGGAGSNGQYYVTTINNVTYNNGVPSAYLVNYNAGPGITGRGFWTATLRIPANPCGTSAFSNALPIVPRGPGNVTNGIVAWYKADMGASGSNWGDVSGLANNMVVGAGAPALGVGMVNFNPAFYYNGSSGHIVPASAAVSGAYTLGGMARLDGSLNSRVFSSQSGTNKLFGWWGGKENTLYVEAWLNAGGAITKNSHLYSFKRSTSPAPAYEFRGDGSALNTGGSTDAGVWQLTVGYLGSGQEFSKVYVPEVYVYNRDITATEMQKVESYLGLKYGLTLGGGAVNYMATDGSTYWTADATYKYRITGIGRDDTTYLNQKESLSQDTGLVTLAVGSKVDTSNAAIAAAITNDKSFFVLADNNLSTSLAAAVTAAGAKSGLRMGRVWTVQKTANWADQPITLRIAGTGGTNYLLVSNDPTFATISQELPIDAGGNVTLNSSGFTGNKYFTVGGNLRGPGAVNNGIALWLRADDGQSTGAVWNDYSGNANGATQASAANQPVLVNNALNFGRSLRFNGINSQMAVPNRAVFNGNVTVYTVYRQLNQGGYQIPIASWGTSGGGWNYWMNYSSSNRREWWTAYGTSSTDQQYDGNYTSKQPEFMGMTATLGTGNGSKNMYLNGAPLLATATATSSYVANTSYPLTIGCNSGGYYWNGDIGESIVYSRVLSAAERQQVESYLGLKYGITLNGGATSYLASDGSTTFWNVTANAGYVKHVTGVGRDSVSGLYQKQSVSVDTGYVTLALGTVVASANELNTAVLADRSFFVIGDNGGSKSFVNTISVAGATFAGQGRVFKVQKTGWADQSLTMATDTTLPLPQDLLISNDPTFATGVTVVPMTRGVVTLSSSQLAGGAYFTFADTLRGPGGVNSGIGAWWRADVGATGSVWTDYSGNGHTQAQAAVASQPSPQAVGINFNPSMYFSGTNFMTSPSVFGTGGIQNSVFFAVALPKNNSTPGGLFGESLNGGGQILAYAPYYSDGQMYFFAPNGGSGTLSIAGPWGGTYGNPYLFAFTRSYQGTSLDESRNNFSVKSYSGTIANSFGNNSPFYLGSQVATNYSYTGQIAEMVVYNNSGSMLLSDRYKIMSYLAFKYGLTLNPLPAGGYVDSKNNSFWNDGTNAGYNYHITGVGRDSVSGLYQLQSVSADTGLVTLALGGLVAASNAANTSVIGADRSFFVFGDNGAPTTYMTGIAGVAGLTTRMGRIFKVQKTNWTDQTMTMKIVGGTPGTYLVTSLDPTFGSGVTKYAFGSDSALHMSSGALLNGAYFTFARQTPAPNGVSNGLALWLRADDGVSNGTQWVDQTGNGLSAAQTAPVNQPVLDAKAINFNYGLVFNNSLSMQVPAGTIAPILPFGNSDRTLISVATQTSAPNTYGTMMVYGNTSGNGTASGLAVYNTGVPFLWGYYYDIGGPAGTYPVNKAMMISGSRTATGSPNSYVYANGVRVGSNTYAWNTPNTSPLMIGQDMAGNGHFNGPISELIIYNRALSAADSQLVYSYLSLKYGLTMDSGAVNYLASNGSAYWTANSTYKKRITGIGRDDSTQLYTRQSLSADTGYVTLALGSSVPLTNQMNTGTITNDRSFFVFADNGGSVNNFSSAVSGSTHGVTLRFARVWMVQKTANWVDQNVTFKVAPIGINNYLLISSDPAFGSVAAELPVKADSTVTLNTSQFNGGKVYFSYGAPILAPGGVGGHSLWLRADVGAGTTTDGMPVGQWNDQSAFANNVAQATAANQPRYKDNQIDNINFNPVLRFDGTDYFTGGSMLKTGTYNGAAAFVVNSQVTPLAASMFNENSTAGPLNMHATWSDNTVYWDAAYNNRISYNVGNVNNLVNLYTGTCDLSLATNKQVLYRNGVQLVTGNGANAYTGNNGTLYIANVSGGTSPFNGRIPEMVVYTLGLTPTQQTQVNSYLAIKYGVTLNNGLTSYLASDGTTNIWTADPTYKYSITGIGRDSVEGLTQLQSRNSDTTRLRIAIGLGEIDSTNSANHNSFGADRSYMVWGDDNGPAGYLTAVSGIGGINYRMTRTWKVQETGSVGSVQVAIPFSSVPNPAGAVLLVSSTGVFDGTSTVYPLSLVDTIAGVKHYVAAVNFTNGQYFTFAANVKAPGGVSGTSLWLRPDQGTSTVADGASLNAWTDYGNQVNTAVQNNTAIQPVYNNNAKMNVNFNPVVQLAAVKAQTMSLDVTKLPTGTTARTMFGVSKPSAAVSGYGYLVTWGAGANYQGTGMGSNGGTGYFLGYNNDMQTSANTVWQSGVVGEQMNVWTGASGGNSASIYSKGLSMAPSPAVYGSWNTGATAALLGGPYWSAGSNWNGSVGDVIVYGRALSLVETQRVETYLAIRYGFSLDQTTAKDYLATDGATKVWDATANATYKYGITGIGYDTTEGLLQLQSRNSDTTRLQVAIGLGEIDSVNSANHNAFGADRSYLVWGDDNTSAGFLTAVSGITGINFRMTRTWKVQETGSVGSVQIAVPFSAVPSPRTAVLLVSNTGTFDATSTVYPLNQVITIAGVRHYAATVDLTSGQYFTFAANVKAPGGVAGTALWLRGDRGLGGIVDGAPVNTWTDYGNQVNTVYQNTATAQPLYGNNGIDNINFNPVLKFNGTSTYLTGASMLKSVVYNNGAAAFTVNNLNAVTNSAIFMETTSGGYMTMELPWSNGLAYYYANGAASYSAGTLTNQTLLWTGSYDPALASNNLTLYQNGIAKAFANQTAAYTGNNGVLNIGYATGWSPYNGRIPEVIVYTSKLTLTQQSQVNTYLAIKYGITLNGGAALSDGSSPYKATDGSTIVWPVDATYKNGITGIGYDSAEDLLQKQSRNSDTTRLRIVVGLGEIDSVNSANPSSFGADRSYLVWGDDNGATTFQTAVSGNPAVNYRMGRTWKVQSTGSVGSVVVAFPYDYLPNPQQSYLVVSNNLIFDGTDNYIPLTKVVVNGKQHWGATVNFSTTQYFTVAAFIKSPGGVGLTSLWLRPDKGIVSSSGGAPSDGQAVNVWVDFANQVNNANQNNLLNVPAYRQSAGFNVNFNPVVQFASSSNQYLNLDVTKLPTGTTGRTIFTMGVPAANPTVNGYAISWGSGTTDQLSGMLYGTVGQGVFPGWGDDVGTAGGFWKGGSFNEQMNIWAGTASGSSATIYSKGLQVATPVVKSGWNTGVTGAAVGGAFFATGQYWNGTMGDVIVFGRQLNANEINRVETYLAMRYGYTIDQTTPTNYTRTDNVSVWNGDATYKYNIAGIGRDDVEGLSQLQSRSVNAGSILTVGLGDIAADNLSNSNSFPADTSYVVWASNSASTASQATNLPTGYSSATRMVQQWKVKMTNFSNSGEPVDMAFDLTGFSYSDTGPNNLVMLVDNDGDGDFTTGAVQKIASNSYDPATKTVRFDDVTTIPDGAVITLAFTKNLLQLNAKVFLQGAWSGSSMSTALQLGGLLPGTDPYGLNTTPSVNPNTSTASVVDWVKVELRDPATPTTVIASRAALLLADGTVVDTNYAQPLNFPAAMGSYYVVIKHRNHLGVMTASPIDFSSGLGSVDFTKAATPTYSRGTNPAQTVTTTNASAMWSGDANGDGKVIYSGAGSDSDYILNSLLGGDPNGYLTGYLNGDVNMDGQIYYISTGNDADWILYAPMGGNPNVTLEAQLP